MAKQAAAKIDVYTIVTDKIVAALESGTNPWECPWSKDSLLPANITTDKAYRGINVLLLWAEAMGQGYQSSKWLTFNQAKKVGGAVQKGAKSSLVTFFKFVKKEDENGDEKIMPVLRYYRVFNSEQVDGLNYPETVLLSEAERLQNVEDTIATFDAQIRHGGHRACYQPLTDIVTLPPFASFKAPEGYYATAFHELVHWTGHESRLNRDLTGRFGDESYAMEELIAELGAAFTCARLGMTYQTQHADYIHSWIRVLKNDKYAIFTAARHATQACDHLLGLDQDGVEGASADGEAE
jgi:antirestriction protein ArdC